MTGPLPRSMAGPEESLPLQSPLREPRARPQRRGAEPGRAMFGRETFIVRVAEDAMAPRVRVGDYVWVDPDEPASDGSFVAVRDPGRGGETVVRLLVERDGRRILRALDERCPERTVDADNETDTRGVVVFVGNEV